MIARTRNHSKRGTGSGEPRLLKGRALQGYNIHYRWTVFSQHIDLGKLAGLRSSDLGPDFAVNFIDHLDRLRVLAPAQGLSETVLNALRSEAEGIPVPSLLLETIMATERAVAIAMHRLDQPAFTRVVTGGDNPDQIELVWECQSPGLSRRVAQLGFAALLESLPEGPASADSEGSFAALLTKLRKRSMRRQWSTNMSVLAQAARQRGLPFESLAGNYLRLGDGGLQQVVSDSSLGSSMGTVGRGVELARTGTGAVDKKKLHQLLVVDGELISALATSAPEIVGDGASSIEQLIARLNEEPARNCAGLRPIAVDGPMWDSLREQGHRRSDVPASGQKIVLLGASSLDRGAVSIDVTDRVHEHTREDVIRAVEERGQAIASVDVLVADIARSCRRVRGHLIAVRQQPDLRIHALLGRGRDRDVGRKALESIFPQGMTGRVPTAVVLGERGTIAVARDLDRFLRARRQPVGLVTRDQTTISGKPVDPTAVGRRGGPEFLLRDPRVGMLVNAISPRRVVQLGLRLDGATVTAILDPAASGDRVAYTAGVDVCIAATTGVVVVGADNPEAASIMTKLDAGRVILVTTRRRGALVQRHLAAGGCVVGPKPGPRRDLIELRRQNEVLAALPVSSLRNGKHKLTGRLLTRALYTAALAFGLGSVGIRATTRPERRVNPVSPPTDLHGSV